ncbi:MAG: S46 family peptidase, partial [Bacteroidales bacterium]|nr:S46 family peptidase [Bacteroidales bacterium]
MKKAFIAISAFLMLSSGARADEGMWLLPLLQKMNSKAMENIGCRLTPEQIYDINHNSLKDAIVQFGGGCTGEIISDKGLLVTNHHCGYGSIQKLSTPEHNYLEDGYWAMQSSEELPVPGLTVRFLQSMTDVTDVLEKTRAAALKEYKDSANAVELANNAWSAAREQMIEAVKKINPDCEVRIVNFYNDNVNYLIIDKVFRDVRFVGAPPASLGKFGGDTDNWMWPRQTCDYSMFRVYAGKNNEPADYSEDNVPYTPKQSLKISLKGVKEGDFSMIMGYPGRTQRFQSASML